MNRRNNVNVVAVLPETGTSYFHLIATAPIASLVDSLVKTVIVTVSKEELEQLRDRIDKLLK